MYMKVVTVKMDSYTLMQIDALVIKLKSTRSAVIRSAVEYVLDNEILPPPVDTERCDIVISVKMPNSMLRELDKFAYKYKLGRSDLVRRAIAEYYKVKNRDEEPIKARVETIKL